MRLHRRDHDHHDGDHVHEGSLRVRDRHDDDLPPPAPGDAVLTSEAEQRIREDERARMRAELEALARAEQAGDVPPAVAPAAATTEMRRDDWRTDVERHERHQRGEDTERLERRTYVEEDVVRERRFSAGQALTLLTGALLGALGILALLTTGIDRPLDQPVEPVFGFDHTPWLGLGELAAGVVLLIAGLRPQGRWLAGLVGLAAIALGVMLLAELNWTTDELGAEPEFGWVAVAAGALALLGALLTPRRHQVITETHRVDDTDDRLA